VLLGEISEARRGAPVLVSLRTNPQGLVAESFRTLSANLRFASIDRPIRSVVVTSAQPDEGKSSVAIGLAQQHAESGQRVLLIDADLRHPTVATYTQLDGTVGLTSVLLGQHDLQDAVQSWGSDTLDVLTAGTTPPNPSQLLSSSSMRLLLEQASSDYDLVVIDSAPIITVTDSLWLGNMADGMLIVVRERFTRHRHLAKAVSAVEGARAELVGVVLNRVKRGDRNSKYYTSEVESVSNIRHAVAERLGR
jgi:capsular exopolysaccharide synthesis family protein